MKRFESVKLFHKTFVGETTKEAYLNACKWYASNVLANEKLHDIFVEYIKKENAVEMNVFASVDETAEFKKYCDLCRAIHSCFYINEPTVCANCTANGYRSRTESLLKSRAKCFKEYMLED